MALADNHEARQILCGDIGEGTCLAACPDDRPPREHADCLLKLRFSSDPEALELARALYAGTDMLAGVAVLGSIDGYVGEEVELFPALPVGKQRHHLEWLHASLSAFDGFVGSLASRAPRVVTFVPRPKAFAFFRTQVPSYPSAYSWQGIIGYNLRGPLHKNPRESHETLFHELFHVNDAVRGDWSPMALGPIFESILARCGDRHECFGPFAPHDSVVAEGTYYAFDERTRNVREYAAELALRYFLEHEAILAGQPAKLPPFKCLTPENHAAWVRLADDFFGGADLAPECNAPEVLQAMGEANSATPHGT